VDRRAFFAATLALLAAPLDVEAQKVPRIGYLSIYTPSDPRGAQWRAAFQHGLRELGYIEGQNITIEYRYAAGNLARLPDLATELARAPVDVILVQGEAALRAAKQATRTIPIVVSVIGDLLGPGHVQSLARPGGNITGLSVLAPELIAKRLELLKETVPDLAQVGVLWNPTNATGVLGLKAAEGAARELGIQLHSLEVRAPDGFDVAFRVARTDRVGALVVLSDSLLAANRRRILDFATKNRLPSNFEDAEYVREGGLMAYGPDVAELNRRAATFVAKILKGAKPADLPVEQPTKFELVINLKTAKALGLTIPPAVLARADEVIE
jgi:putative ABC transport system substrate-binding protein